MIKIKINKQTRMIGLTKSIIGNDNENLQEQLEFSFEDEFVEGQARLEYVTQDGTKNWVQMERVNDTYQIPVKSVFTKEGKIDMQIVITQGISEEETPIFKSNVFYMVCGKSINAETEAPASYDTWIEIANKKLNEVDNLDIDGTQETNGATIVITRKDKTKKELTITGKEGKPGKPGEPGKDYVLTEEDRIEIGNVATTNSKSEFKQYYDTKVGEFNENTTAKTKSFNENATNKTNDYNTNHDDKLKAYNDNATTQTNSYNTNANKKLEAYDTNDTTKTTAYNENTAQKTKEFNLNAKTKLDEFNQNAASYDQRISDNFDEINRLTAEVGDNEKDIKDLRRDLQGTLFKNTEKGNPIVLTDSGEASPVDYKIEGETNQIETKGYNFFVDIPTQTLNGVTLTNNRDGSYTLNGKASAFTEFRSTKDISSKERTLTIEYKASIPANKVFVVTRRKDNYLVHQLKVVNEGLYSQTKTSEISTYGITVVDGTLLNNLTIKVALQEGNTFNNTFEPYTNGVASPSPEFSQPIENARIESIENTATNLFIQDFMHEPDDGASTKLLPKGIYTICNVNKNTFSGNNNLYIKLYRNGKAITEPNHLVGINWSPQFSGVSYNYYGANGKDNVTFTIDDNYELSIGELNTRQSKVMLVRGETPNYNYEPYKGNTYTFSKPIELASGKTIYEKKDTIEKNKETGLWEVIRRRKKITINAELARSGYITDVYAGNRPLTTMMRIGKYEMGIKKGTYVFCNKLINNFQLWGADEIGIGTVEKTIDFRLLKSELGITEADDQNVKKEKVIEWLKSNPMEAEYELDENFYTHEPLPEEDSAMLDKIQTFYPNTTLITQSGQEIVYLADGKLYVDRRIKELTQKVVEEVTRTNNAIVSMGGETNV